jgi:hypothetical protein
LGERRKGADLAYVVCPDIVISCGTPELAFPWHIVVRLWYVFCSYSIYVWKYGTYVEGLCLM